MTQEHDDQQSFTNQEHEINVPCDDPDPRWSVYGAIVSDHEYKLNIPESSVNEAMVSDYEHKLNIPSTSYYKPPSAPPEPNLPCADLYNGCREDYINICVPLYHASVNCDWQAAKVIFDKNPELVRFGITQNLETPLHVAVTTKSTKKMIEFVQNLVNLMDIKDLELQNKSYNTAFGLATMAGNVQGVKIIVKKNWALLDIPGNHGFMPLHWAAYFGKHDMVRYIYDNSQHMAGDFWTSKKCARVLVICIQADMFDVALNIVKDRMELTKDKSTCRELLYALARKPDAFNTRKQTSIQGIVNSITSCLKVAFVEKDDSDALKLLRIIWGAVMNMPKTDIDDILEGNATFNVPSYTEKYSSRIIFEASKMGNTAFVVELLRGYPDLIWKQDDSGLTIIHVAVKYHHEDIYNLFHELPGSMKVRITPIVDKLDYNLLHLTAMWTNKNEKKGISMKLVQQFLWYKEVKMLVPPTLREMSNKDGMTPREWFLQLTKYFYDDSLLWADYGSVVATLIIALSFAAGVTVPGGFNQSNGIPIFVHELLYSVFVVANAISLFTSTISVIAFLSIVIFGRGAREQYMEYEPTSIALGLTALLVSLLAMMVTFSASLFLLCHNRLKWILMSIIACASLTILMYVSTQYPLLVDLLRSINETRHLFKGRKGRKLT